MSVKCHICGWSSTSDKVDSCPFCKCKIECDCLTNYKRSELHKEMKVLKMKISLAKINNEKTNEYEKRIKEIEEDMNFNLDEDSKEFKKRKYKLGRVDKKESWYKDAPSKYMKIFRGGRGG